MDEKKTLYKLEEYNKNIILDSVKILSNKSKRPEECQDFIHIGDDIFIDVEDLIGWIENLNYEVEHAQEELEDFKNEVEEYYKPRYRDEYDLYGVSPRDFM